MTDISLSHNQSQERNKKKTASNLEKRELELEASSLFTVQVPCVNNPSVQSAKADEYIKICRFIEFKM